MSNNFWCPVLFSRHHNVDVSVAVSADSGLITPIVFNADKKVSIKVKKMRKKRTLTTIRLGNAEAAAILLTMTHLGVK